MHQKLTVKKKFETKRTKENKEKNESRREKKQWSARKKRKYPTNNTNTYKRVCDETAPPSVPVSATSTRIHNEPSPKVVQKGIFK